MYRPGPLLIWAMNWAADSGFAKTTSAAFKAYFSLASLTSIAVTAPQWMAAKNFLGLMDNGTSVM